jgi:uncharacterized protein (DUF697 family)
LEEKLEETNREKEAYWRQAEETKRQAEAEKEQREEEENNRQFELEQMVGKANKAVIATMAAAGAAVMIPIPLADLPVLVGEQTILMGTIAAIFKIDIKKDGLKTLAFAAFSVSGLATIGKSIAISLLKLFPGVGHIANGVINGPVAMIMTCAMGNAFIEICKAVKLGELREEDITSREGIDLFKKAFKDFAKRWGKNNGTA